MRPQPVSTQHECHAIALASELPAIDVQFGACRAYPQGNFFDIVDFAQRRIDRWFTPPIEVGEAKACLRAQVRPEDFPGNADFFIKEMLSTHVLQVSPQGLLFVNRGNFLNGSSFTIIDTRCGEAVLIREEPGEEPYFYTCTGGFTPDYQRWYFMRWPLSDSIALLNGEAQTAHCQIGAVELNAGEVHVVGEIENDDRIHQVTPSPDGRYLVFTSFKSDLRVRYPRATWEEDPLGYRRSHEAGIIPKDVVTLDLQTGEYWRTAVPVPVSAHLEFDLLDPAVFYVSGHNFSINHQPDVIVEGPGAIIKMRIEAGQTPVIGMYHPRDLFRVSQHVPFLYEGRTLIAVTNTPNKLDLLDGASMRLWRREELFAHAPLDFSRTGSCISPMPDKAFFSINPSKDGRFIVLESSESFHIYSVDEACFLDAAVPRGLPPGAKGTGHTRIVGR
jgi:hypothetical protein